MTSKLLTIISAAALAGLAGCVSTPSQKVLALGNSSRDSYSEWAFDVFPAGQTTIGDPIFQNLYFTEARQGPDKNCLRSVYASFKDSEKGMVLKSVEKNKHCVIPEKNMGFWENSIFLDRDGDGNMDYYCFSEGVTHFGNRTTKHVDCSGNTNRPKIDFFLPYALGWAVDTMDDTY